MAEKEYIEREALTEHIKDLPTWDYIAKADGVYEKSTKYPEGNFNCDDVINSINNAPAADVVEVKHGEWKEGHYEGGLLDGVIFDKCNICGYERLIEDVKYKTTYKYCPNCGAKMDLEERLNDI